MLLLWFAGWLGSPATASAPASERVAVATELLAERLDIVLIGAKKVPADLEAELWGTLRPEIEAHGQPDGTRDWLYLLGAADGDVDALLERVGLAQQGQWAYVAHENEALRSAEVRDVVPLLAHASAIVRSRAARRLEAEPDAAMKSLRLAWRFAPGRAAPLRGEVAVPVLPWSARTADQWSRTLVHWAKRTNRQRDDRALHATLQLLSRPEVTSRLAEVQRVQIGQHLSRATRVHRTSERSAELVQAMDAVLRQVSWEEARAPAPEEHVDGRPTWMRRAPAK